MSRGADVRLTQAAAVVVALGLLGMAAALVLYSVDQRSTADFLRTLSLPGQEPPDTSSYESLSAGSLTEAAVSLVMAVGAWRLRGRVLFMVTAIWSLLAVGTGAWIALETTPRLESINVGPAHVSMVLAGGLLATAALVSLAGSAAGWVTSPSWLRPNRSYMPPETHQA